MLVPRRNRWTPEPKSYQNTQHVRNSKPKNLKKLSMTFNGKLFLKNILILSYKTKIF